MEEVYYTRIKAIIAVRIRCDSRNSRTGMLGGGIFKILAARRHKRRKTDRSRARSLTRSCRREERSDVAIQLKGRG